MWPMSGAARNQLVQSHTMCARVDVLHAGRSVYTLVPYSGTINAQATRSVMRNLGCTVIDPTGALSGGDIDDLLSPYDCEVAPYRGVLRVPGDLSSAEWVPQGVFRLTARNVMGDGQVQLTGQDRAMLYQGPMSGALAISGGTPIETAISMLLQTRQPGVHMHTWVTGFTCGPLLYAPDIDVWAEAQKLAQSVGGWLFHDRTGDLVFASLLPASTLPVARYAEGELLVSATRQEDSDTIHNVIVMQNADKTITAVAEDDDPSSPTYSRGAYGRRVDVVTNEHVGSMEQAQQAATAQLVQELGRSETVAVTIPPDPGLDPLDAATVHRPLIGLVERTLVAQEVDTSLSAQDAMTVTFRKYILTRDGSTLQTQMDAVS